MIFELDIQQGFKQITGPCTWEQCGPILAALIIGDMGGANITDDFDLNVSELELDAIKSPFSADYSLTLGSIINRAYSQWAGEWRWSWNHRDGGIIAYCLEQMTDADKAMLREPAHG